MAGDLPHPNWRSEWQDAKAHGFAQPAWAQMIGTTPEYAKLLVKGKRTGTRPLTHEREAYDVTIRSGPQAGRTRHIPARRVSGSIAERFWHITTVDGLWRVTWQDRAKRYHRVVFRTVPGQDGHWLVRAAVTAIFREIERMDYPVAFWRITAMAPIKHARPDSEVYAIWPQDVVL